MHGAKPSAGDNEVHVFMCTLVWNTWPIEGVIAWGMVLERCLDKFIEAFDFAHVTFSAASLGTFPARFGLVPLCLYHLRPGNKLFN